MKFKIDTQEEANRALEFFNHFHDGFIKRITIISNDDFDKQKSQLLTGKFDIMIEFAHYNYNNGKPSFNQIIKAEFTDTKDIKFIFQEVRDNDWNIQSISIQEDKKGRFGFILKRSVFIDKWTPCEDKLFTFVSAEIEE